MRSTLLLSLWFAIALSESLMTETYNKLLAQYKEPVYSASLESTKQFFAYQKIENVPQEEIYGKAKIIANEKLNEVGRILHKCLDEAYNNKNGQYPPENGAKKNAEKLARKISHYLDPEKSTGRSGLHRRFAGFGSFFKSLSKGAGKVLTKGGDDFAKIVGKSSRNLANQADGVATSSRRILTNGGDDSARLVKSTRNLANQADGVGNGKIDWEGMQFRTKEEVRKELSKMKSFRYKLKAQFKKGAFIQQMKIFVTPTIMKVYLAVSLGIGAILVLTDFFTGNKAAFASEDESNQNLEPSQNIYDPLDPSQNIYGPLDPSQNIYGPLDPSQNIYGQLDPSEYDYGLSELGYSGKSELGYSGNYDVNQQSNSYGASQYYGVSPPAKAYGTSQLGYSGNYGANQQSNSYGASQYYGANPLAKAYGASQLGYNGYYGANSKTNFYEASQSASSAN